MRLFSFLLERIEHTSVGSPQKKVCFDCFVHTLSITFLAGCLGRQPGDEPGAEESDHYSNEGAGNGEPEWNRLP